MAVGNVGERLVKYTDSDTFLSRDAGFTWEEVHKDAHLWEFGDSGSVLVMANDEQPTDVVLYSTDEGLTWREYRFADEKIRVSAIVTVPSDTSRRFILLGQHARSQGTTAVHLDFSALTNQQCACGALSDDRWLTCARRQARYPGPATRRFRTVEPQRGEERTVPIRSPGLSLLCGLLDVGFC
jgi:hypothetical protein